MSYVVLARRYRPQVFADLVGQEHVTRTLSNAVLQKRTAHAYLFTGPRGVGKTSAARILAKALRCLDLTPSGDPCNKCAACEGVNAGSSMDVIEIDAASNTGVDNIRDLRENVEYMATIGKYRVYIIDEVHMLSTAAFNALLKTLEEPPPHVVFIFATTELHKVLPTIQSRCQRFDFKKIAADVMTQKLNEICSKEKVQIDDASIKTLVTESEGCLRDAESLLDQAIALCGNEITIQKLESALGLLDRASFFELVKSVGDHDPGRALKLSAQMMAKGIDAKVLLNRLVDFFCDLHYRAFTGESRVPDVEMDAHFASLCEKLSKDEVVRAMDLGLKTQASLYQAVSTPMAVESFIVKLCLQRPALPAAGAQPSSASGNGNGAPRGGTPTRAAQPAQQAPMQQSAAAPAPRPAPVQQSARGLSNGEAPDLAPLESYIRQHRPAWTPVLQSILAMENSDGVLKVRVKADFAGKRLASNDGIEVLQLAYGVKRAVVQTEVSANATVTVVDPREKLMQKQTMAKEHEAVKAAIKVFDAVITETKILEDGKGVSP